MLAHSLRTMATITAVKRFKEAMHIVYGPFDGLSMEEVAEWTPPDKPGAGGHRGRYLWTDAFGVVNFITLHRETSSAAYLGLAKRLVAAVHDVLGRTRDGTARLPGATDGEPLKGGLRIGKVDESGADGDGQYHHYLTLWMFALNRLALATGETAYNDLAIQLARAIHPRFVIHGDKEHGDCGSRLRMVWKISTDMTDVLVPREGHLDAATGYVVCRLLQKAAASLSSSTKGPSPAKVLESETADYQALTGRGRMSLPHDALDLGMGLWMCHACDEPWAVDLGKKTLAIAPGILEGLRARDPVQRLAFREFGACLGVQCFGISYGEGGEEGWRMEESVEKTVEFWEKYLEESLDEDLRPISLVMYAAALIPGAWREGYLSSSL